MSCLKIGTEYLGLYHSTISFVNSSIIFFLLVKYRLKEVNQEKVY